MNMPTTEEEWRTCADYPMYEVSSFGNIRRVKRPQRLLLCSRRKSGRRMITIQNNYKVKGVLVARLILITFKGYPLPGKPYARHLDDNPGNDRIDNLEWGSQKDNMDDCRKNGSFARGQAKIDRKAVGIKVAAALRGTHHSPEIIKKRAQSLSKLVWITNEIDSRFVLPPVVLPEGWRYGRPKGQKRSSETIARMRVAASLREQKRRETKLSV
jgi:hypothetical protein